MLPSGYYIYIKTSLHSINDSARILSPSLTTSGSTCVLFWYHMFGSDVSTLNMYVMTSSGSMGRPVWTKAGTQGDRWIAGQVDLGAQSGTKVQEYRNPPSVFM